MTAGKNSIQLTDNAANMVGVVWITPPEFPAVVWLTYLQGGCVGGAVLVFLNMHVCTWTYSVRCVVATCIVYFNTGYVK